MEPKPVSRKLLRRLSVYLNYLKNLPEDSVNVSATEMARALELGDVQVRKDLARISIGRRRTGRNRRQLMKDIEEYLSFAEETGTIVVGAGKLGRALLDYVGFEDSGLRIVAGFDIASKRHTKGGKRIYPMAELAQFCRDNRISIAIITVPAENAQSVCDELVACGIRAIWNFAPVHLNVPDHIVVQSENLAVSLTTLRLQLKNQHVSNAS